MTADLVTRLRGIIAAKPPHVTVLADNEEVYPIRVELLREAADKIAQLSSVVLNQNVAILDVHDRAEKAEARLAAAEEYVVHRTRQIDEQNARLAAAERVVEALARLHETDCYIVNEYGHSCDEFQRIIRSEKAYSAKLSREFMVGHHPECGMRRPGENLAGSWVCVTECEATDLNFPEREGK